MRGKEATQAANRRTAVALERVALLELELQQERADRASEVSALRGQLARDHSDIVDQAEAMARLDLGQVKSDAERVAREFQQSIEALKGEYAERSQKALNLLYDRLSPAELHELAIVLGASARDVEAAKFLDGHSDFATTKAEDRSVPNRRVRRAVGRITEQKARNLAVASEAEARLRTFNLGPEVGKAGGTHGHA